MQYGSHETDRQFQVYFSRQHVWGDTILLLISIPPFLWMPLMYSFSSILWAMWSSMLLYLITCVAAVFLQRDAYIAHREITILLLHMLLNTFGIVYFPLVVECSAMAAAQGSTTTHSRNLPLSHLLQTSKSVAVVCNSIFFSTFNGVFLPLRSTNNLYRCALAVLCYAVANPTICKLAVDLGWTSDAVPMWVVRLLGQGFGLGESQATEVTCKCALNSAMVVFGGVLVTVINARHERACLREFERSRGVAVGQQRLFRWPTSKEELLPLELVVHMALLVVSCPATWDRLCRMGLSRDNGS